MQSSRSASIMLWKAYIRVAMFSMTILRLVFLFFLRKQHPSQKAERYTRSLSICSHYATRSLLFLPHPTQSSTLQSHFQHHPVPSLNATSLQTGCHAPDDVAANPKYDGDRFGFNISRISCNEAYTRITWPAMTGELTFGDRAQGTWDVQLPFRSLSGKSCIVFQYLRPQILFAGNRFWWTTSGRNMRH